MMVSICMITYNHENYLQQTIEAVLNQKATFKIDTIDRDVMVLTLIK